MVLPSAYLVRFINQYFEVRWLPQAERYQVQVDAEIRFRIERSIDESIAALEKIERTSPNAMSLTQCRFPSQMSQHQVLTTAIDQITVYQRYLDGGIAELGYWQQWIRKPDYFSTLRESLALAERIRRLLIITKQFVETNDAYFRRLRRQLYDFHQSLGNKQSFGISSTSLSAILEASFRDAASSGDARIRIFESRIARLCEDRNSGNIIPRDIYIFCVIRALRTTLSEVDDITLDHVQRSWLIERRGAIHRYEFSTATDLNSGADLGWEIYQAHNEETPIPADR